MLRYSDWHDFSYYLESRLHNRVHGWTGGFMGQVPLAAYDPIFFAHHTMVDRLWSMWQVRHSQVGPPPDQWKIVLEPFTQALPELLGHYAASTFHLQVG